MEGTSLQFVHPYFSIHLQSDEMMHYPVAAELVLVDLFSLRNKIDLLFNPENNKNLSAIQTNQFLKIVAVIHADLERQGT